MTTTRTSPLLEPRSAGEALVPPIDPSIVASVMLAEAEVLKLQAELAARQSELSSDFLRDMSPLGRNQR